MKELLKFYEEGPSPQIPRLLVRQI